MAIDVSFFTFEKDSNSTATPATGAGVVQSCLLREPCSILNPVLQLDITAMGATSPAAINYCHIPAFGRYYWVNDWTYERGFWVASCSVDALASWKTDIGNSTQYVVRSANQFNGDIPDTLYPINSSPIYNQSAQELENYPFTNQIAQGFYIVGITNGDTSAVGTTAYYAFTQTQFRTFANKLFSSDMADLMVGGGIDITTNLLKSVVNPAQYISSAVWFPIKTMPTFTDVTNIPIGWWTLSGARCRKLSSMVGFYTIELPGVPTHPQTAERGTFVNLAPYTRHKLVFPAFGNFEIPSEWMVGRTAVLLSVLVDFVSGAGKLIISAKNANIEQICYDIQVGVPVSLHSVTNDLAGAGMGIINGVGNALTGNILGAVSGIGNAALSAVTPIVSTISQNGTFNGHFYNPYIVTEFHTIAGEDRERLGRPLCDTRQIKTLKRNEAHSGYILCGNVELDIGATPSEITEITTAMESGFFYVE